MNDPLASEEDLDDFLQGFREGTWPVSQWKHREHIIMASSYLIESGVTEATSRIRTGIKSYNLAQGGENTVAKGYHETLTIFWIGLLIKFLGRQEPGKSRVERVREATAEFGGKCDLFKNYYSYDVVASREARMKWMAPDRQEWD